MLEPTSEQMRAFRILLERTLGDKESGLVLVPSPHPGFVDLKLGGPNGGCILSRLSLVKVIADSKHALRAGAPKTEMFDVGALLDNFFGDFFGKPEELKPENTILVAERDQLRREVASMRESAKAVEKLLAAVQTERDDLRRELAKRTTSHHTDDYTGPESGGRS